MRVIKDLVIEIPDTNVHHFNLDEFNDDDGIDVLVYGYNALRNTELQKKISNYKRKVYFNVTMPTEFCGKVPTIQDNFFDEVYTICPYSIEWLNEITNSNKYKLICYPFNSKNEPPETEKTYDVCYHGGIHGDVHVGCLNTMRKFNYRYMSMSHSINGLTKDHLKYATNIDLSNQEKINLVSQCKISIAYNNFPVRGNTDVNNIKNKENWQRNEAFKHIDDLGIIPQFKSRVNEAMIARTLNLVQKDPWNVIEKFYIPDVHFVYFESNEELEGKIQDILNNWGDYQKIAENAYNESMKYTTKKLYNKIKTENNEM